LYDLHLEKKWSIKDEGDRWESITVIIKIPLSTETAKFLNLTVRQEDSNETKKY
jgi:hypothetical protein